MLKHHNIAHFYQFLAEAIIVFLIINPVTYAYFDISHYWGYIFIIFITGGCFFVIEKYNQPVGYYVLAFLISAFLFYLFQFPLGLILLLPLIFIWRYIRIRSYENNLQSEMHLHKHDAHYNREMIYLNVTVLIGVVDVIIAQEIFVMYFVFLQFNILLAGHLFSHLSLLNKQERKKINVSIFLSIPALLVTGTAVIYFLFDPFRQVIAQAWQAFQTFIVFFLANIMRLIGVILPDIKKPNMTEEQEDLMIESQQQEEEEGNPFEAIKNETGIDESILVLVVTSIIIAIIIYFIIRAYKNRREQLNVVADKTVVHRSLDPKRKESDGLFRRIFNRATRQPSHPVRKLVFKFERIAEKNEFGRYYFESMEEWFNRLQVDVNVSIYEKVRYGDLDASEQEIDVLEQQLKAIDFTEVAKNMTKKNEFQE